jgi:6-phosphogluconolactonase (cycloisomerase 2 family)
VDGRALIGTLGVAVSPDGKSAYAAAYSSGAIAVFDRAPDGTLTQKSGIAGCVSETGTTGTCADGNALKGTSSVTVTHDGKNVYATSVISDAIVAFDRAPDGKLTEKTAIAGCISETGTAGTCVDGRALDGAFSVTSSTTDDSVYVASMDGDAIAVLDRARDGTLTQKTGAAGCISETGGGGCVDGRALDGASAVALAPDDASLYATSLTSSAVAVFDRAPDGTLTQKAGTAGCISETGTAGACVDGNALNATISVTISPDAKHVYVAARDGDAISLFDRAPDGSLTQKPGTAGCISDTATAGTCTHGKALDQASTITISPDGASVYATTQSSDALVVLDRAPNGTLTQKAGIAGCISDTGTAGACTAAKALNGASSVTVTPDGDNVYTSAYDSSAIASFTRRPS